MYTSTNDRLISPVFANELADYARLDSDDPTIDAMLLSATSIVLAYTKLEMIKRRYTLRFKHWPTVGISTARNLSPSMMIYKQDIELPFANLIEVVSVKVNGTLTDDYVVFEGRPDKLHFDSIYINDDDTYALEVIYDAGYGASGYDVPQAVRNAILMVASHLHTKNGVCNYGNAVKDSGAAELLTPYSVRAGISI